MAPSFDELTKMSRLQRNNEPFTGTLLCFDPGETTGFAVFKGDTLDEAEQMRTKDLVDSAILIDGLINKRLMGNVRVVIEDYRVYSWKTESHAWENLHTAKLIGVIVACCGLHGVPYHMQMAQQTKGFCTDSKLKQWGMYQVGKSHARDAIRHGCYYLLFGK